MTTGPTVRRKPNVAYLAAFLAVQAFFLVWLVANQYGSDAEYLAGEALGANSFADSIAHAFAWLGILLVWMVTDLVLTSIYVIYRLGNPA